MAITFVHGNTLEEVWRMTLGAVLAEGRRIAINHGSFSNGGTTRLQLDSLVLQADHPGMRPLAPIDPVLTATTSDRKIIDYYERYILGTEQAREELYTYGAYIVPQVPPVIEILGKGYGNQATITVGDPKSVLLSDPPCLRIIDFVNVGGRLDMHLYWRSWDVYAGMPENLGGLQLLKEELATITGLKDGTLYAYSKGAHIYSYAEEQARKWALRWIT